MRLSHLLLAALLALAGPARAADNTLERVLELSASNCCANRPRRCCSAACRPSSRRRWGRPSRLRRCVADLASKVAKQVSASNWMPRWRARQPAGAAFHRRRAGRGRGWWPARLPPAAAGRPPLGKRLGWCSAWTRPRIPPSWPPCCATRWARPRPCWRCAPAVATSTRSPGRADGGPAAAAARVQRQRHRGLHALRLPADPSEQLAEYAALYERAPLRAVLEASAQALPEVFAARRGQAQNKQKGPEGPFLPGAALSAGG